MTAEVEKVQQAVANFRYKLRGLVRGQTFKVMADAGPSCTVVTKPSECSS
jgi:hypothetical protein